MDIYILRHATAAPLGEQGVKRDEDRPITDEGRKQVAAAAAALARMGVTFDRILTSPLLRTVQTAEELVQRLPEPRPEMVPCEALAPGGKPKKLAKALLHEEGRAVLLVGHEPDLGQHTAWLIGGKKAQVRYGKGGLALIQCDGPPEKGAGVLAWLLSPKWLAAVSQEQ